MHLRPNTFGMTAILAMLTALGPLSTDMYLPSLPAIAAALGTDAARVQFTLSAYLAGFALGQILYGPVSDKIGRKPVVLAGIALFCVATAACALANSIEFLIGARLVQAMGAAGPIVLGRAIVRDLYEGARAGRELSRMGMLMGLVPTVAPLMGGLLEPLFGWRSNFWAVLCGALMLAICVILFLPETLKHQRPEPISVINILRGFRVLLQNQTFRLHVMLAGFAYAGLFSFISGSSFVLQSAYGLSPVAFALSFSSSVLGFILGTIIAQRIVTTRGLEGTIRLGVRCLAAGGLTMLALMLIRTGSVWEVTIPMMIYTFGIGLVLPQASASAMMPFPDRAGAASSLQGIIQMSFAALVGSLLGILLIRTPLMMPIFISAMGVGAFVLFSLGRPVPQPPA
jgi:MFS transporter, DHA1 family, multidrug resistance protein